MAEKKLNITELAELTGVSRNAIGDIYHERAQMIRLHTLSVLCDALQCTPNDIFIIERRQQGQQAR